MPKPHRVHVKSYWMLEIEHELQPLLDSSQTREELQRAIDQHPNREKLILNVTIGTDSDGKPIQVNFIMPGYPETVRLYRT